MEETQQDVQEQTDRTDRANSALLAGRFQIVQTDPLQWTVKNGDNLPYSVSLHGADWSCTCPDFQQNGPDLRCKHIEGVRLLQQAEPGSPSSSTPASKTEAQLNRKDRILTELRQPLDMARTKRRLAPGSGTVPYLEGHTIIDRANEIFDFSWSFELISTPEIVHWQKKVLAWNDQEKRKLPVLDSQGNIMTEEVGIVYITGRIRLDLEDTSVNHSDLGRCIFSGDTPEALDMALAGAVTDCLKRCFRQMGSQFGNDLYDRVISGTNQSQNTARRTTSPSVRKYSDGVKVNGNKSEQDAFDRYLSRTGKAPASRETLRSWLMSQNQTPKPAATAA
jgi:hypothetical protein